MVYVKQGFAIGMILLVAGCAAPLGEVIEDAHECVNNYIDDKGIIGNPPQEQRDQCWKEANDKIESAAKRKAKKDSEFTCGAGKVAWCTNRTRITKDNRDCTCISSSTMREILRRSGLGQ
jgi:hypothetical protein